MFRWLPFLAIATSAAGAAAPNKADRPASISDALEACLQKEGPEFDLGTAALLIGKEEFPQTEVAALTKQLDALAAKLAKALADAGTASGKLAALRKLLFEDEKFGLPKEDNAEAFLLNKVLEHKRGNCLGLSVLCLALAERTRMPLHGVPVPSRGSGPGHLLIRYDDGTVRVNFDPTEAGAAHDDEHYRKLFGLTPGDLKKGYILGNAKPKEVANLLLVNLGGARVEAGHAKDAVPLLERAIELKGDYAPTHGNLGAALLKLGALSQAEACFKKALELDANLIGARLGLAEVYLASGLIAQAEEEAMTAEALEPKNLEAKVLLANVSLARGEYAPAMRALQAIVEKQPQDARARTNLGTAQRLSGDFSGAEQSFRGALAVTPDHADAHFGLGETLRATGKIKEAREAYADALKADPAHANTRLALAHLARQANDARTAVEQYERILADTPLHLEALGALAELLIQQGRVPEAQTRVAKALEQVPGHPGLRLVQGELLARTGNIQPALAHFEDLLKDSSEIQRPHVLMWIAVCHGKLRRHAQALKIAQDLLKERPSDLGALRIAAAACEGLRHASEAIGYYQKILELAPHDEAAKKALGRLGR